MECRLTSLKVYTFAGVLVVLLQALCQWLYVRRGACVGSRRHVQKVGPRLARGTVRLDCVLFWRIIKLLRICFPSALSLESTVVALLTALLFARTRLTLTLAGIAGVTSEALVRRDTRRLLFSIADFAAYAIPTTVISVGIGYTTSLLERRFRDKVQQFFHENYLRGRRVHDLAAMGSVDNPSHRITSDVQSFCCEIASLLPSVLKPLMEVVIFSSTLMRSGGFGAPFSVISYYVLVALIFRALLPNFATLVATSREKEASLRMLHAQLVLHAEEVAFYRGANVERRYADRLLRSFLSLERHIKRVKWWTSVLHGLFVEYGSTCVALIACVITVRQKRGLLDAAGLTQLSMRNLQLYISLSKSVAKLFSLHLKVGAVCGSAHRLGELRDALQHLECVEKKSALSVVEVLDSDVITFNNALVCSPADKAVLVDFSLTLTPGHNVLIKGGNGSGKTSLLRVLCGLWPLHGGSIRRPPLSRLLLLTQRTYLSSGTLRSQLIYPEIEQDGEARFRNDETLLKLVECVGLRGIVEREGGLDSQRAWGEVLSGGEKQRVAVVRALYHRPIFVFIDECTSAVSQDTEPVLYGALRDAGVTLVTISHRESLKVYHDSLITLDGFGGSSVYAVPEV
ncbi:putative ABC transporter transmembrane region 2 ABC transporter [Trypanosoma vivax]|uniref:Putative ABC transporter n=1 Tax=Trypanosoma vivax (strain Y486) TaxID=1055687 RepID=G0UAK0_TRYVY|nr:putative ABC transporter transmembrane region 2 ABC transporter [Trypanosoma vivax]CCC52833.1 putative ABC transporter [Trypanosoma vivax Y486]